MLSLFSISTASLTLLLGWFVGQPLQMGLAGMVIGSGLAGQRLRTLFVRVAALVLLLVAATIAMQSTGLAHAVQLGTGRVR